MADAGTWLVIVGFGCALILTRPPIMRVLARRAEQFSDHRYEVNRRRALAQQDPDEAELWRWNRRLRLCAALNRIEALIRTDTDMSATRQLGNRLARDQLLHELRRDTERAGVAYLAPLDPVLSGATNVRAVAGESSRIEAIRATAARVADGTTTGAASVERLEWRGTRVIHATAA